MTKYQRKITKEQYERAMLNNSFLTEEDEKDIFTVSELYGYGVYLPIVIKEQGEYYVTFKLGSTCD